MDGIAPPDRGHAPNDVLAAQAPCDSNLLARAPDRLAMEGISYVEAAPVPEPVLPSRQLTVAEPVSTEAGDGAYHVVQASAATTHEASAVPSPQRSLSQEHAAHSINSAMASFDAPVTSSSVVPLSAANVVPLSHTGGSDLTGAAMSQAEGMATPHNGHVLTSHDPASGQTSVPHYANGPYAMPQHSNENNADPQAHSGAGSSEQGPPEGDGGRRTSRRYE